MKNSLEKILKEYSDLTDKTNEKIENVVASYRNNTFEALFPAVHPLLNVPPTLPEPLGYCPTGVLFLTALSNLAASSFALD